MSDLIDDPQEGGNAPEFSVSDLSGVIKRMIEGEFSHVRVRGELGRISRWRRRGSLRRSASRRCPICPRSSGL